MHYRRHGKACDVHYMYSRHGKAGDLHYSKQESRLICIIVTRESGMGKRVLCIVHCNYTKKQLVDIVVMGNQVLGIVIMESSHGKTCVRHSIFGKAVVSYKNMGK